MTQFKNAALRQERVLQALGRGVPLSTTQIYQDANVYGVSNSHTSVNDALKALHAKGQVRKLPKAVINGKLNAMWEFINPVTTTKVVKRIKRGRVILEDILTPPAPTPVYKPTIAVTERLVTIELSGVRITVEV